MANFSFINNLPRRIAKLYQGLFSISSKMQRSAQSIGFIKKAIYNEVTPTFAKLKGQFINDKDRKKAEKDLLLAHLNNHYKELNSLKIRHWDILNLLKLEAGAKFVNLLNSTVSKRLQEERMLSFKKKNKKLNVLIMEKHKLQINNYRVPLINLSDEIGSDCRNLILEYFRSSALAA